MTPERFKEYAENEVMLARKVLATDPENQRHRDRLAYWSLKLGDTATAQEFGTSPKLLGMIQECLETN